MCGIAGLVYSGVSPFDVAPAMRRMVTSLAHRGPDDDGFLLAPGIAMGMRRLSIIDLQTGAQPVSSDDGRFTVVFNGEIYNYRELRAALMARGRRFTTHSDTEVIANGLAEHGVAFVSQLRGMFAVAAWDVAGQLLLIRDRLGKKPLYLLRGHGWLAFGSEIKALRQLGTPLSRDPSAIDDYFTFGFIPEPGTIYQEIVQLPAASWLTWADGREQQATYWSLPTAVTPMTEADAVDRLDVLLAEAVDLRLRSDVPVGVFLSGGLDSSAVVAYAARASRHTVSTFSVGFDRPAWDETADAERVARAFGTHHTALRLSGAAMQADLPALIMDIVQACDQPFGDSSAVPTLLVSRLAAQHVKVILGGDGADELLAGYSTYRGLAFARAWSRLPAPARRLARSMVAGARHGPGPLPRQSQRIGTILDNSVGSTDDLYLRKMTLLDAASRSRLLLGARPGTRMTPVEPDKDWVNAVSRADLRFRLLNDMLVKIDRMSMAASLEVRSPFLDHHLVEFLVQLPGDLKLRGSRTKYVLRRLLQPMLPQETLRKRKQGFAVPLRDWFQGPLYSMLTDLAEPQRVTDAGLDWHEVERLAREHRRGERDNAVALWLVVVFLAWSQLDQTETLGRGALHVA